VRCGAKGNLSGGVKDNGTPTNAHATGVQGRHWRRYQRLIASPALTKRFLDYTQRRILRGFPTYLRRSRAQRANIVRRRSRCRSGKIEVMQCRPLNATSRFQAVMHEGFPYFCLGKC
jgi:hypothetical protein